MIYTCYEMVRDCRADRPEGWSYFISQYVPVTRKLLAHYGHPALLERVLVALRRPESSMFDSLEPAPERWFVAELRQKILAELPAHPPEIAIDLETLGAALEPLTLTEKQAVWLETMQYAPQQTGTLLRMSANTVEKIRASAAERIRGKVDAWRSTLLADNGLMLGRAAAQARGAECFPAKVFLDVLDGRTTWSGREQMDRHVLLCWHCIDHFCRMAEVIEVLRGNQPLAENETAHFQELLGVRSIRKSAWKRFIGAR